MSKSMRLPLCAAALSLCASAPASAGPFASASYAHTSMEYSDVGRGHGVSLSAGFQGDSLPIFVEAEYFNSGKMDYEFLSDDVGVEYTGFKAYLGYALALGPSWMWLKGGGYSLDGKIPGYTSEKLSGLSLGVGFDWMFTSSVGLRLEVDTPFKVDPLPGQPYDEETQLSTIKVGLVWRLPSAPSSSPAYSSSSASQPAAEPVNQPVAVPRQPMPVPRPLPAPAAAPAARAASSGPVSPSRAYLRSQPASSAGAVREISTSSVLTLQKSVDNAEGRWWYAVTPDGARGWVADADLSK